MATAIAERQKLTPPQLAALWGIDPNKVIRWIESGELRAINAASNTGGRPRYLIGRDDIEQFEARRAVSPPAPATPRRRRSAGNGVKEFF